MEQNSLTVSLNYFCYTILCFIMTEIFLLDYFFFNGELKVGVASGTTSSFFLLIGSVLAIFSHADWNHLIGNVVCILFCMPLLCRKLTFSQFISLTVTGILGTGYIAWSLDTREFGEAMHIGCSGLIWSYSIVVLTYCFRHFIAGLLKTSEVLSYVAIFFSIILGIPGLFPSDGMISWQMHIGGLIVGLIFSVYLLIHRESFLYQFYNNSVKD